MDDALGAAVLEQRAAHLLPASTQVVAQVLAEPAQVAVQHVDLEELLVRPAGRQRDRVRVVVGDLVEEVHRVQRRVLERGVQVRGDQVRARCGPAAQARSAARHGCTTTGTTSARSRATGHRTAAPAGRRRSSGPHSRTVDSPAPRGRRRSPPASWRRGAPLPAGTARVHARARRRRPARTAAAGRPARRPPRTRAPQHVDAAADAAVEQHLGPAGRPRRRPRAARRCWRRAPSSWRPPWLDTTTASTPDSTARTGVPRVEDSLEHQRQVGPARSQSRSAQLERRARTRRSVCAAIADSPGTRRVPGSRAVGRGWRPTTSSGSANALRTSRSRRPRSARRRSPSAPAQPASSARATSGSTSPASAQPVQLEPRACRRRRRPPRPGTLLSVLTHVRHPGRRARPRRWPARRRGAAAAGRPSAPPRAASPRRCRAGGSPVSVRPTPPSTRGSTATASSAARLAAQRRSPRRCRRRRSPTPPAAAAPRPARATSATVSRSSRRHRCTSLPQELGRLRDGPPARRRARRTS